MKDTRGLGTRGFAIATTILVCALILISIVPAVAAGKAKVPAPTAPQGVVAATIDPGVCIDWQPSTDAAIEGYRVYARSGKTWKRLNRTLATENHYYDPQGITGQGYAVSAVDVSGVESSLTIVAAEVVSPVIHEENDPGVSVEGPWNVEAYPGASGGTVIAASESGAMLRFRFTGRQVKLIAVNHSGCGKANVYVDNDFLATVDLYSTEQLQQVEVNVPGLSYEEHEIAVLVLGYGNPGGAVNSVNVDAFEVR